MSDNFEFPIKNFKSRAKLLDWYLIHSDQQNGFYCESCLKHKNEKLVLVSIIDKKIHPDPNYDCPGRVLPCCLDCGLKHNLINQNRIDTADIMHEETKWEKQLNPIVQWSNEALKIVKNRMKVEI